MIIALQILTEHARFALSHFPKRVQLEIASSPFPHFSSMRTLTIIDWIALVLAIVGGINWGLVGLFQYDLVAMLLGGTSLMLVRAVYVVVGLAALYLLLLLPKLAKK